MSTYIKKLTGREKFMNYSKTLDFDILDFWQNMFSDLEFPFIFRSLAIFLTTKAVGNNFECKDLHVKNYVTHKKGWLLGFGDAVKITNNKEPSKSKVRFNINPSFYNNGKLKIFIFYVLNESKSNQELLNLDNWEFYVLSREKLKDFFNGGINELTVDELRTLDVRSHSFKTLKKAFTSEMLY